LKGRKPVFLNRRWQREDDMRYLVRNLADKGEKMVQEDRLTDFIEYFEESTNSDISDLYETDSDEDFNELKRMQTTVKFIKTKRQDVRKHKEKQKIRNIHTIDRVERVKIDASGKIIE